MQMETPSSTPAAIYPQIISRYYNEVMDSLLDERNVIAKMSQEKFKEQLEEIIAPNRVRFERVTSIS